MRELRISLSQLEYLLILGHDVVVLVGAKWKQQDFSYRNIINTLLQPLSQRIDVLYYLESIGSDDIESYLINELELFEYPTIVYYSKGKIFHKQSFKQNDSFTTDIGLLLYSLYSFQSSELQPNLTISTYLQYISKTSNTSYLFIAGDRSQVGKSSICLGILGTLVKNGVNPSLLAYIKPVTQCEAKQPVTIYCEKLGITYESISPIIFYKGFTRAFLNNETDSTENMLLHIIESIKQISVNKRFVLIDGVGYPSVGSIVGLSNAQVAKSLNLPVLLVGKSGVGKNNSFILFYFILL